MAETLGIAETKEVFIAATNLSAEIVKRLKDGAQMNDIAELIKNEGLIAELKAAIKDADKIPAEMKDLSLAEGLELGQLALTQGQKLLVEIRKPKAV